MNAPRSLFRRAVTAGLLTPAMALAFTTSACGGKEGGDSAGVYDQSATPLKAFEVDVDGHAITVSMPETFTRIEDSPFTEFRPVADTEFGLPTFIFSTINIGPPKSLDDMSLKSESSRFKMEVAKREEVAGGFLITGHNDKKATVEVVFVKLTPEGKGLSCWGKQARDEGVPNPDKTLEMLEKACTSMALK